MNQPYTSMEIGYGGTPSRCPVRQNLPPGQYLSCKENLAPEEIVKPFDLTDFILENGAVSIVEMDSLGDTLLCQDKVCFEKSGEPCSDFVAEK